MSLDARRRSRSPWLLPMACALAASGGATGAHAAISLEMRLAAPASTDVMLLWEAEGPGPFTLVEWTLEGHGRVADALELEPAGEVARTGLTGGSLLLAGDALLPPGIGLRAYGLVDESDGSCSNLGYVARRSHLLAGSSVFLAMPERSAVATLADVLDQFPAVDRVELWQPDRCRKIVLERRAGGGRRGLDAFIPAGRAVLARIARDADLVIAGASGWRHDATRVDLHAGGCPNGFPNIEHLASPFALDWSTSFELLCGREGLDWEDADGDARPDTCPSGAFDGSHAAAVSLGQRDGADNLVTTVASLRLGRLAFSGGAFDVDPVAGWAFGASDRVPASFALATRDLGAQDACRCGDTDGDGDDDCTERLYGTDPLDPSSRGPDADLDGVLDDADDCPADADPGQEDRDGDGFGDACDPDPDDPVNAVADSDGDSVLDGLDDCPDDYDPSQANRDGDSFGDACDACPDAFDVQADSDHDGLGDACDTCPLDPAPDPDLDGACSGDNCPRAPNADQRDSDLDGFGDACDCGFDPSLLPEVLGLRVTGVGRSAVILRRLSWDDDRASLPGFVDEKVFDVRDGPLERLHADGNLGYGGCVARGLPEPELVDGPSSGSRWYLVRMRSACRDGELGAAGAPGGPNPRDLIVRSAQFGCP